MSYKITHKIKTLLEAGKKYFVVYPYGRNGEQIYRILKKYVNKENIMVVDNLLCKSNNTIKSFEEFMLHDFKKYCILFSAQNSDIRRLLMPSLLLNAEQYNGIVDIFSPFPFVQKDHFNVLHNDAAKKLLLKSSLSLVEIEVFSYCNRQCWFCPNSFIDRHTSNTYMSEQDYLNILKQLYDLDYRGKISYSRYNEPLSDKIILTRIKQAHQLLPNATLHTNTNGDFLTDEYIRELYDAGLRSLNIQVYIRMDECFLEAAIKKRLDAKLDSLKLTALKKTCISNEWVEIVSAYYDMNIRLYARNFYINGCNRGDSLSNLPGNNFNRISPCTQPFIAIYIDYNGNVVPCCNIRSDNPKHKQYVLGNIREDNLFNIYGSCKATSWRKAVFNCSENKILPCRSCTFLLMDNNNDDCRLKLQEMKHT